MERLGCLFKGGNVGEDDVEFALEFFTGLLAGLTLDQDERRHLADTLVCQIASKGDPCFASDNDPFEALECYVSQVRRVGGDWGAGEAATQGGRSPTGVAVSPAINPFPCRSWGQLRFLKRQESLPVSMISQ